MHDVGITPSVIRIACKGIPEGGTVELQAIKNMNDDCLPAHLVPIQNLSPKVVQISGDREP